MSFIPTRPPTTYVNTRLVDDLQCSLLAARKTKLNAFASMLPHCAVHMLRAISLHFSRAPLNGCGFWDGPIVFQRLHASPHPSLQQAFCGMPPLTSQPFGVTCVLKNCESHDLYPFSQERPAVWEELRVK